MDLHLGSEAAFRENIVIEVMINYLWNLEENDEKIFSLSEAKQRINLSGRHIEVALSDLRAQGVLEIEGVFTETITPYYKFTKGFLDKHFLTEYSGFISNREGGSWIQRGSKNGRNGFMMWYGKNANLRGKYYKVT